MYLDELDDIHPDGHTDKLIIGKFCSIASGALFMLGGTQGHNYNWISNYPLDFLDDDYDNYQTIPPKAHQFKGDTVIGNDVWIGAEALIMPGIKIGDGAVIGARAVVTKNIGAYEIWAGNPARLIKKRFSDDEISMLLELKWWDWDLEKIKQYLHIIRSNNVSALFQQAKR
jgi:chloramphenicol O-acetyltransferase type B